MTPPRRGLLLVISSPSGAGKSSLTRRLAQDNPEASLSVSATTRQPRPGEREGREYHFVSDAGFDAMIHEGAFLEWAKVHDHRYGTPAAPVRAALAEGRDMLFDIDWQGAAAIRGSMGPDAVTVFILPPTMAALAGRLKTRAQDAPEVIARRLARAKGEIAHWGEYDYVVVNDDFEAAARTLAHILAAERARRVRNPWLEGLVDRLEAEPPS
ncbi:MAG TPA: guanylate kinase [Caulobacteraceae bacterium]|nr:guanylate kinase [Caulobacteraceae bacterium]